MTLLGNSRQHAMWIKKVKLIKHWVCRVTGVIITLLIALYLPHCHPYQYFSTMNLLRWHYRILTWTPFATSLLSMTGPHLIRASTFPFWTRLPERRQLSWCCDCSVVSLMNTWEFDSIEWWIWSCQFFNVTLDLGKTVSVWFFLLFSLY